MVCFSEDNIQVLRGGNIKSVVVHGFYPPASY